MCRRLNCNLVKLPLNCKLIKRPFRLLCPSSPTTAGQLLLLIGSAQYAPLETFPAQNFPSKSSKTSSSVGGLLAAITGFLGWKYLCYKRSVWSASGWSVWLTSKIPPSVGKPKRSPVTDMPIIISPVFLFASLITDKVIPTNITRTGLSWVVLVRGLPETALGNVLANVGRSQQRLWETGSRYVAPRHISRRPNLREATSLLTLWLLLKTTLFAAYVTIIIVGENDSMKWSKVESQLSVLFKMMTRDEGERLKSWEKMIPVSVFQRRRRPSPKLRPKMGTAQVSLLLLLLLMESQAVSPTGRTEVKTPKV